MCKFNIKYEGNPANIMAAAKEMIERNGGTFTATDTVASFTVHTPVGNVVGTCVWADPTTIGVTITKKPFLAPCSVIKDKMAAAFVEVSKSSSAA